MSLKKRKIEKLTDNIPIYPTKIKHAKYSNSSVVIPRIVKVDAPNFDFESKINLKKIEELVGKMQNRINKLETLLKYQNKKIDTLEFNLNKLETTQENNEEMLELVRDVETKLNLPEIKSKTTDFSYIS